MKQRLFFILTCASLFFGSFLITNRVLADIVTNTIGTPICDSYMSPEGDKCYELRCTFQTGNSPVNYDKCESVDGKWEDPKATYKATLCEHGTCKSPSDVLSCETKLA
ncbi:MAG TPA: hypothetical protein VK892_04040 [Pyrinomonadaceae bacterium]|nr:hypothetical protein [Pyrinomonadaceae bacterium]